MEPTSPPETGKKVVLENLSKEELIKRCERLLIIAQKAKQAKDLLQEENTELKQRQGSGDTTEIIEKLTQQKLEYVTTIEDLKNKLRKCEDRDQLENENVSFKRQIKRLTDENEQLITHLDSLEKQLEECKTLGLEQQNQLLTLEKNNKLLEDANKRLQSENTENKAAELQKMLSISLEEVKKLQTENNTMREKIDVLKTTLGEKDKNILIISEELQSEKGRIEMSKDRLRLYHSKIVKLAGNIKALKEDKNGVLNLFKTYTNQVEDWKKQLNSASQILYQQMSNITSQNQVLKESNAKYLKQLEAHKTDDEKSKELDEFERISSELKKVTEENRKLQECVEELTERNKKLQEFQNELAQKIEEVTSEKNVLEEKLEELKEEKKEVQVELKQRIEENTSEKIRQIEENEKLQELKQKIEELAEENKKLNERIEEIVFEKSILSEKLHQMEEQTKAQIEEITSEKLEGLAVENNMLLDIQNELKQKIEELTDENKKLKQKIEELASEKTLLSQNLTDAEAKHQEEIKILDDQSKKDTIEIQNRIEENEKICIEYRKIISKLEEDLDMSTRELNEAKQKNYSLQEALEHSKETEKQIADKTSEEILKLVHENAELIQKLQERCENRKENETQTEDSENDLEELVTSLKRENSELLTEMNEMNQALKERGETISKFQSHCEEVMKKLQLYENQANKNVDNITQKEEIIKRLEAEIERLKGSDECDSDSKQKDTEIIELKNEVESLKEKLNANLDDSECMSTSTISRTEEVNRMKDLEGSWEERYGKLRNLAIKLKGKVRELSNELSKEQNEKNNLQQKCSTNVKTIATLQSQCDKLQDELDDSRKQQKELSNQLESSITEISKTKQKLAENDELISALKKEIEELNQEKVTTEAWKKQISGKVQTFRKELEANKVLKKEYEAKIAKLTADLEAKDQALKAESEYHSNNERKKNSVLSLEMQDYERSVKELSQKLEKKQEELNKLKSQLESQKNTTNAVREQNKILEERVEEMKSEINLAQSEVTAYRKQISELEDAIGGKETKILDLTQLLETIRSENEELATELSKVIAEHQKVNGALRNERDNLKCQILGLQQSLREVQDVLKLKEDELKAVQNEYESYKVRAQSVLRQNQSRDVCLEEKLSEEVSALGIKSEALTTELKESKNLIEVLRKENEVLTREKCELASKYEEVAGEVDDLKCLYDQLTNKHQQTMIEHSETVRSLKVHAETLAQCYRQQLSEQEVRHNREIIELQSKIEKAPSPELTLPPLPMHREEGEGSESTESTKIMHPVPLERLLGTDSEQEVVFLKKQLNEEESKVAHLTALLADTEQDLAKHAQMNKLLKEEIRRQQRSVEREKHAENLEYLKNVVFKFVTLHNGDERSRLVPVLNTILKLSPEETQKLNMVARGDPGRGWTNYLPLWPSPSK